MNARGLNPLAGKGSRYTHEHPRTYIGRLNSVKCRFESDWGHDCTAGRGAVAPSFGRGQAGHPGVNLAARDAGRGDR